MTHVLDALGRIKEYWGSVALADLDDYAQGRIIRGGAVDWEAYDASTLGAVLIGDGADVISDTTPTFVGVVTFNAGITMGGASGANEFTIPDNIAIAMELLDVGGLEYMRIVSTNANPYILMFPSSGGAVGVGTQTPLAVAGAAYGIGATILNVYEATDYARIVIQGNNLGAGLDLVDLGGLVDKKWMQLYMDAGSLRYRSLTDAGALVNATMLCINLTTSYCGFGVLAAATMIEEEEIKTLTGNVGDDYAAALTLDPGYTGAFTVTRHSYIVIEDVSVAGGAAVTDSAVFRFNAAIGTHKALPAAFQTTDSGADTTNWAGGLLINILGVLYKIPYIAA